MASSKTYVVEGSVKKSNLQDGGNKWKKGTVTLSQGEDNIWTCTAHIDVNPKSSFIEFKVSVASLVIPEDYCGALSHVVHGTRLMC